MRLIEPLGYLDPPAARESVAAGFALPLAGGPAAFALARLIDAGPGPHPVVPVARIPPPWWPERDRITLPIPGWAGLPADRPLVMGIVNVTPDSFSDGGDRAAPGDAIEAGRAMAAAGADIIDIGGESTRPGAVPVTADEEQDRILPVIRALAADGLTVSVDTRNAATMAAALDAGARIINDVSGLAHDKQAATVVASRGCPVVLMHMRGVPQTMAGLTEYDDVSVEVTRALGNLVAAAVAAGIARERIVVDPGIGFAKNGQQSLEMIRRVGLLCNLGCRILVGASRKSLIGHIVGPVAPSRRLAGSLAMALHAYARGASILRVHDVPETVQALRLWRAVADNTSQ